jgi:AraC family transcriptional regulator
MASSRTALRESTAWLVQEHITANLDQRLTSGIVADLARLSRAHFCRAFKATFGSTFRRYVQCRRLDHACRLMAETDLPLVEIAYECGMTDQAHFCNCFRARFGKSPGQWRRDSSDDA